MRVEPFLTVYGELDESLEIKQDISKLESRFLDLNRKIEEQKQTIDLLHNNLEQIARDAVERYLREEIASSEKDLQKWSEELMLDDSMKRMVSNY